VATQSFKFIPAAAWQRSHEARAALATTSSETLKTNGEAHSYHLMIRQYHGPMVHAPGNGVKYKRITSAAIWRPSESVIESILAIVIRRPGAPVLQPARTCFQAS
jgi:hypothetical protein